MGMAFGAIGIAILVAVAAVALFGIVLAFSANSSGARAVGIVICVVVGGFLVLTVAGVGLVSLRSSSPMPYPVAATSVGPSSGMVATRGGEIRVVVDYSGTSRDKVDPLYEFLEDVRTERFGAFRGSSGSSHSTSSSGFSASGTMMSSMTPDASNDWEEALAVAHTAAKELKAEAAKLGLASDVVVRVTDANGIALDLVAATESPSASDTEEGYGGDVAPTSPEAPPAY